MCVYVSIHIYTHHLCRVLQKTESLIMACNAAWIPGGKIWFYGNNLLFLTIFLFSLDGRSMGIGPFSFIYLFLGNDYSMVLKESRACVQVC